MLSEEERVAYNSVKQKIRYLNNIKRELQGDLTSYQYRQKTLEDDLKRLLVNIDRSLERQLHEVTQTAEQGLKNRSAEIHAEQKLLEEQLKAIRQFRHDLEEGKKAATWLDINSESLSRMAGKHALRWQIFHKPISQIFNHPSSEEAEIFFKTLKKFIDRIIHCLTWGRANVLDARTVTLNLDWRIYELALKYIKNQAWQDTKRSSSISKEAFSQLETYINRLIHQLKYYPQKE